MKKIQRVLSWLLVLCMVVAILPITVLAVTDPHAKRLVDSSSEAYLYTEYLLNGGYEEILDGVQFDKKDMEIYTCLLDYDDDNTKELLIKIIDNDYPGGNNPPTYGALLEIEDGKGCLKVKTYKTNGTNGGSTLYFGYDNEQKKYILGSHYETLGIGYSTESMSIYSPDYEVALSYGLTWCEENSMAADWMRGNGYGEFLYDQGNGIYEYYQIGEDYVTLEAFSAMQKRFDWNTHVLVKGTYEVPVEIPVMEQPSEEDTKPATVRYTFSLSSGTGSNWNPHTWISSDDDSMLDYLSAPLANMSIKDSANGIYQWVFVAATGVTDVTADHKDDLTKYGVTLPEGQTAEETEKGFVFEIALNPDMKWEDGTPINADSYIYSMEQLLNPDMKNYRANLYYAGESAVAGGDKFYYAGDTAWIDAASAYRMADLVVAEDGSYTTADGAPVMFSVSGALAWLGGNSLADYVAAYGDAMFDVASFDALTAMADENGNVAVNEETIDLLTKVITFSADWGETEDNIADYLVYGKVYPECEYDGTVGCYKVDDYTIRYVNQTQIDYNYFMTSMTSNWLVYEDLYEAGKDTTGSLVTTNYNTSLDTTMSYGPYRMESRKEGEQVVFVKNENYYLYTRNKDNTLTATTEYLVDGKHVPAYQTDRIIIDAMPDNQVYQAFIKGQLDTMLPDDAGKFLSSGKLYRAPETYTMSFFFDCGLEDLKEMDCTKGNKNSVVLSNLNFRKAISLSIDRNAFVELTAGYLPSFTILNSQYYYDIYNDPESSYRNSNQAKSAIINFYGIEYGPGTPYADLDKAYASIDGYELADARRLMAVACAELVKDGLYKKGEPIHIRVGWTKGSLGTYDYQQVELLSDFINTAAEGSGFGTITLEAVGNINNRYDDVANGEYAIGCGAWGGAAFYPFRNFQVYCDPDQYAINEAGCWDPTTETLTLTVEGEEVTKTWQEWSGCMVGSGDMANKSFETKLQILADMEENYLNFFYRIPLASTTVTELLSYQCDYYTDEYNIMYGFGGLELMTYNFTDEEWEAYIAANKLDYTKPLDKPSEECKHTDVSVQNEEKASCTKAGYSGDQICEDCGVVIQEGTEIPATDHVYADGFCKICSKTDEKAIERQVLYFNGYDETGANFGDWELYYYKVTEKTDSSFLETASDLRGEHVLVESVGDTLFSIAAVDTKIGTVTAVSVGKVTVSGIEYSVADYVANEETLKDAFVVFYLNNGQIVDIEPLKAVTGTVATWESDWMGFTFAYAEGENGPPSGKLSKAAEAGSRELLQKAAEEGFEVRIYVDGGNFLYKIEWLEEEHIHEYIQTVTPPTCDKAGYTTYTCACGDRYVDNNVDATGHAFADGKCTVCGESDPDWEAPAEPKPEGTEPPRIAGSNRFETANLVGNQMKKNLGIEKFDAVVVASGTEFADALAGSYLAAVKKAPILLAYSTDKINAGVKDYIRANLNEGGTIYILGGENAVPTSFETGLEGFAIKRLAGAHRFETNLMVLKEAGIGDNPILVATGLTFADSLSASAAKLPILLVYGDKLLPDQAAFLSENQGRNLYILGGEGAVNEKMEAVLTAYGTVERVAGKNRFETSVKIAEKFFNDPESAVLAYAWDFPDGLCGGPLATTMNAPLILTMEKYEVKAAEYIQGQSISKAVILGGEKLIPDTSVDLIMK